MLADETTEGILCIEMRIRMYHDGAMSKLLEKLSEVSGVHEVVFVASFAAHVH